MTEFQPDGRQGAASGASIAASLPRVLSTCLALFILSRLVLMAIGLMAQELILPRLAPEHQFGHPDFPVWLDVWVAWDSGWFLSIVDNGYMTATVLEGPTANQANWAFFPLYPMLATALVALTGLDGFLALVIVANLCFAAALVVAWVEANDAYGRRAADLAVLLFCIVPGSHFFSSAYSESTFLLFALLTFAFARRRMWLAAGAMAALATLTRNTGILLAIPMVLMFAADRLATAGYSWRGAIRDYLPPAETIRLAGGLALPLVGLGCFMIFLGFRTGDPLAFVNVQAGWGRTLDWPWEALSPFSEPTEMAPHLVAAWVAVVLSGVLIHRRDWPYAGFAIACVALFLSAGVLSMLRLALTVAPLVLVASALLAQSRRIAVVVLSGLAMVEGSLMVGWTIGLPIY